MLLFFAPTNALISGHPGGPTPGYPWAFAQWRLQIPPTQNQCFFLQKDGESFYLAQFYLNGLPVNIIYCLITREVIGHAGRT